MADSPDIQALCERARHYCEQDRLLPLQSNSWYTGFASDGRQMLLTHDDQSIRLCWFDNDGRLLLGEVIAHGLELPPVGTWQPQDFRRLERFLGERFGFRGSAIHVRPFQDRETGLAVKLLPDWLADFAWDPRQLPEEDRPYFADDLRQWLTKQDTYALEAWGNTFFIDGIQGHCTAS
jgi:hypothetical protein